MNFIDSIIELVKNICTWLGFSDSFAAKIVTYLLLAVITGYIAYFAFKYFRIIIKKRNEKKLSRNLLPYYSPADFSIALKYFVPTYFQNNDPSDSEEPDFQYITSAKQELIPYLINEKFCNNESHNRFYIILADSGMGKTTFMLNLYIKYLKKVYFSKHKYEIKLFALGHENALDEIKNITEEKKKSTILLLDAFDEDNSAILDYKKRLSEILKECIKFRLVLLTCRTQFFPSQSEEPHKTGHTNFGGNSFQYEFQKLYLSAFDTKQVDRYLRKKFNPWNPFKTKKFKKAKEVIQSAPRLSARPMLLSQIDLLIDKNAEFNYSYEIYRTLIESWLERESSKPGVIYKYNNSNVYKVLLNNFSKKLAIHLYLYQGNEKQFYIDRTELANGSLAQFNDELIEIELHESEKGSRSLLNRTADGKYKFSHKSILEYYLADYCFSNDEFFQKMNFSAMDMCLQFYTEMLHSKCCRNKNIVFLSSNLWVDASLLDISMFKKCQHIKFLNLNNVNLFQFKIIHNLKHIYIDDDNINRFLVILLLNREYSWHENRKIYDFLHKLDKYPNLLLIINAISRNRKDSDIFKYAMENKLFPTDLSKIQYHLITINNNEEIVLSYEYYFDINPESLQFVSKNHYSTITFFEIETNLSKLVTFAAQINCSITLMGRDIKLE